MAHEIEVDANTGQAAAAFARMPAWHKLGQTFPDDQYLTADQVLDAAHLRGWNVRRVALGTVSETANESGLIVPNTYATVRDNPFTPGQVDVLSRNGKAVSGQWTPVQMEETVEFLETLAHMSDGGQFDTAGSLANGARTFVSMRLPEYLSVGGKDDIEANIVVLNSNDGTGGLTCLVTMVRVVCANTERAALANNISSWTLRHTKSITGRVQDARNSLGLTLAFRDEFAAEAERMVATPLNDKGFTKVVERLWPVPVKDDTTPRQQRDYDEFRGTIRNLWAQTDKESDTLGDIGGTHWAGYNVVTEWADHYSKIRTSNPDRQAARAERALGPQMTKIKNQAFDFFRIPVKGEQGKGKAKLIAV